MATRSPTVVLRVVETDGAEPRPKPVVGEVAELPMGGREDLLAHVLEVLVADAEIAKEPPDVPTVRMDDLTYAGSLMDQARSIRRNHPHRSHWLPSPMSG